MLASFPVVCPSAVKSTALITFIWEPEINSLLPISTSVGIPVEEIVGAGYSMVKLPSETPSPTELLNTIFPLFALPVTLSDKRSLDTF